MAEKSRVKTPVEETHIKGYPQGGTSTVEEHVEARTASAGAETSGNPVVEGAKGAGKALVAGLGGALAGVGGAVSGVGGAVSGVGGAVEQVGSTIVDAVGTKGPSSSENKK